MQRKFFTLYNRNAEQEESSHKNCKLNLTKFPSPNPFFRFHPSRERSSSSRRALVCVQPKARCNANEPSPLHTARIHVFLSTEDRSIGVNMNLLSCSFTSICNYSANLLFESPTARNLSNFIQIKQILMAKIFKNLTDLEKICWISARQGTP